MEAVIDKEAHSTMKSWSHSWLITSIINHSPCTKVADLFSEGVWNREIYHWRRRKSRQDNWSISSLKDHRGTDKCHILKPNRKKASSLETSPLTNPQIASVMWSIHGLFHSAYWGNVKGWGWQCVLEADYSSIDNWNMAWPCMVEAHHKRIRTWIKQQHGLHENIFLSGDIQRGELLGQLPVGRI